MGPAIVVALEAPQVDQLMQLAGIADEVADQVLAEAAGLQGRPALSRIQAHDFGHLPHRDRVGALLEDPRHVVTPSSRGLADCRADPGRGMRRGAAAAQRLGVATHATDLVFAHAHLVKRFCHRGLPAVTGAVSSVRRVGRRHARGLEGQTPHAPQRVGKVPHAGHSRTNGTTAQAGGEHARPMERSGRARHRLCRCLSMGEVRTLASERGGSEVRRRAPVQTTAQPREACPVPQQARDRRKPSPTHPDGRGTSRCRDEESPARTQRAQAEGSGQVPDARQ